MDIDCKRINWKRMGIVRNILGLEFDFAKSSICKTKKGFHIRLFIKNKMTDKDICFVQMAMGSDYKRESNNYVRVRNHEDNWNVLFSQKYASEKLLGEVFKVSEETPMQSQKMFERNLGQVH